VLDSEQSWVPESVKASPQNEDSYSMNKQMVKHHVDNFKRQMNQRNPGTKSGVLDGDTSTSQFSNINHAQKGR